MFPIQDIRRRCRYRSCHVSVAIFMALLWALLGFGSAHAREDPAGPKTFLKVGMPAGFSDLVGLQRAVVDIYFGDRKIGQASIDYEPGGVRFVDAKSIVAMVPDIANPSAVRAALEDVHLPTHVDLLCSQGADRTTCGRLQPEVAAVIFDPDSFRLSLFINPRFLKIRAAVDETYLPRPTATLSLVDSIAGTFAGGSGGGEVYAFQNRAVLGARDARIANVTSYVTGGRIRSDVLVAQVDKPGIRYTAGAFWSGGIDLVGRRKILGAGLETQFDTRFDRELLNGSPIIVSLSQRSRVDLMIDGRLMSSRTYEAGNQSLDTSGMPEGAYEVILHIQEISGGKRDERRFFTKNSHVAPMGRLLAFARGGVLVDDQKDAFLSPTRRPYFEAGIGKRLSQRLAIDGTLVAVSDRVIAEFGGNLIIPIAQIRLAALASTRHDTGLLLQANSSGSSRLNFNFDLRHIQSHNGRPLVPAIDQLIGSSVRDVSGYQQTQFGAGSFTQLIGDISYRLKHAQITFSAFYRRDSQKKSSYAIGPTARWSILQRRGLDVSLEANLSQSNTGRSSFAGVRLQLLRPHMSVGSTVGGQTISSSVDGRQSAIVGGIQANWQTENVVGADLMLAGSFDHTASSDLVHGRADMRGPRGAAAADIVQQTNGAAGNQYSLSFQSAVIANKDMLQLGGKGESDSIIAVNVKSQAPTSTFEVLVNETPRGQINGGGTLPIAVTSYRQYNVRIRPIGGKIVHFDNSSRRVSVYPGNVAALTWTIKPVVAMFGRAIRPDGTPIGDADVIAEDAIGHTDQQGYFQIETSPQTQATVHSTDGSSCRATLNAIERDSGYAALGSVICYGSVILGEPSQIAAR